MEERRMGLYPKVFLIKKVMKEFQKRTIRFGTQIETTSWKATCTVVALSGLTIAEYFP